MWKRWTFPTTIDWLFIRVPVVVPDYGRYPATAVSSVPTATITASASRKRHWREAHTSPHPKRTGERRGQKIAVAGQTMANQTNEKSGIGYGVLFTLVLLLALSGFAVFQLYPGLIGAGTGLILLAAAAGTASLFSPCSFPLLVTLPPTGSGKRASPWPTSWPITPGWCSFIFRVCQIARKSSRTTVEHRL